ncbi:hypothetical protein ACFQY0_07315 [Haloferula chungangensis]|uniref:Choice-of-anchor D domain-containing protein n=1 Tax=Haloferula chungangensis TaxID=1048331 RepID=A0ABW2L3S1_9BACT
MALSHPLWAAFDDSQWLNFGGDPGFNGNVRAMVFDEDGNLYCAGDFTSVDGLEANRVAMWDGTSWFALGDGINNRVNSLAVADGILYAGGQFTEAGGRSVINIAKWDGTEWSALGTHPNGSVFSLAIQGDDLFVGGSFTMAGGKTVNNIARWDGESWNAIGSGTNGPVNALISNGSTLTAGGDFTLVNGVAVNRIAQWNSTEWSALGSGVNDPVYALTQSGTDIYVGGNFTQAGGLSSGRKVAKWNGTVWSGLGDGVGQDVFAIAVNDEDVFVGMSRSVIQWNGSAWIPLGSGTNGLVRTLAIDRLDLYVGGAFTTAGGHTASYAAHAITAFEPNIAIELPEGTRIENESTVDFGDIAIDSTNGRYVFTIQNYGNVVLTVTTIALTGGDDLDSFELDSGTALSPLVPDEQGNFSVTFLPTEAGEKTVNLELLSSDPDTPAFTLTITGTGADPVDMYFDAADEAGLTEFDTLPDATPYDDGVENVLKYGFNLDLAASDSSTLTPEGSSGLPRYELLENDGEHFFRFEYLRRKGSGLIYTPLKSPDLSSPFTKVLGTETIEDIDRQWERVFIDEPVDLTTQPTCFGRVEVELPITIAP